LGLISAIRHLQNDFCHPGGVFAADGLRVADLDGLDVRPEDERIDKTRFSAFYGTGLDAWLAETGIARLVIAGVRTDVCVETTVRDAFMRDLEVALAAESSASYLPDLHRASLRALGVIFAEIADQPRAIEPLKS
jgi:ureidoacrylate peracid hydrolase